MLENSKKRLDDILFYGLYMVPEILIEIGVTSRNLRKTSVEGFELRIGNNATLLRTSAAITPRMVFSLTHTEIEKLYRGAGLYKYSIKSLLAKVSGKVMPVLCYTLITPPSESETNPDYEYKLAIAMKKNRLV